MSEIELDCPSCKEHLILDEAFAGGVCRCSNCGTVMSVPSAKTPLSPSRPGGPAIRPDLPAGVKSHRRKQRRQMIDEITVEAEQEAIEAQTERLAPGATDTDEVLLAQEEIDDRESSAHHAMLVTSKDDGSFVTPSGRTISVSSKDSIPTAPGLPKARPQPAHRNLLTTFLGMLIMTASTILILGMTYFAMKLLTEQADRSADPENGTIVKAPTSNPFTSGKANFFHIPLANQTALVIDGYGLSNAWTSHMKKSMVAASGTFGPNAAQFFFFTDVEETQIYPAEAQVFTSIHQQELKELIETGIHTINVSDPMVALAKALESKPRQVILMTGQKFSREKIRAIGDKIGQAKLRFDVILVDVSDIQWTRLTATYGGQCLTIEESQVVQWLSAPAGAGPAAGADTDGGKKQP